MRIRGNIYMIELDHKVIGIKSYKHIDFYYFQNSQMNLLKKYLYQDNWIEFEYDEKLVKKGQYLAHRIDFVYKIEAIGKYDHITYFDKHVLDLSLNKFLFNLDNKMFLDFEMTMPSYEFKGRGFVTEIIQAGFEIFDKDNNSTYKYSKYIKPTTAPTISKRTENFLKINAEEFNASAIKYNEFYNDLKKVIKKYNPVIIIYGKNDKIVLEDSYKINKKQSITSRTRYINLCNLIKNFYNLRNDPGLFKLHQIYYGIADETQVHDALDDSIVLKEVFEAFKNDIKSHKYFEKIREVFYN